VDTFAVATPKAIGYAVKHIREWFPKTQIEFHVHNDFGLGMATALAALENGATVIHTAMNALGERTGNLATEEMATTLGILLGNRTKVKLEKLWETSRVVGDITGIQPNVNKTVFGKNCFAIESGVVSHYTNALRKAGFKPIAYPYLPEVVWRTEDSFLIGALSGRLTVDYYLEKNGVTASEEQKEAVLRAMKEECIVRRTCLSEEDFIAVAKRTLAKK
jgi:2-isopropylmalate synthase